MEKSKGDNSQGKNKPFYFEWLGLLIAIVAILVSSLSSYYVFVQSEEQSKSSTQQLDRINSNSIDQLKKINEAETLLQKQLQLKYIEFQEKSNKDKINLQNEIKEISEKQLIQNSTFNAQSLHLSNKSNELNSNYNKLIEDIELIKQQLKESQIVLGFMVQSANALRCDVTVDSASKVLSFASTQLFNTLKKPSSRILLIQFITEISSPRICNGKSRAGIIVTLQGVDLSELNLYGIRIDNLYCKQCVLTGLQYSNRAFYEMGEACKESYLGRYENTSIADKCGWKYEDYTYPPYQEMRENERKYTY